MTANRYRHARVVEPIVYMHGDTEKMEITSLNSCIQVRPYLLLPQARQIVRGLTRFAIVMDLITLSAVHIGQITDQKQLALWLRYQTTHERGFHKAMNDLLKLRAAKRKEQIGFESQQRAERDDKRKQERHQWDILLAEAKVDGQQLRDLNHDIKESERLRAYMNSLKAA
jgi:hypothetical protein